MIKQIFLITLLMISRRAEELEDAIETDDEFDQAEDVNTQQSISDVDSKEFVEALNKYFDSIDKHTVTHDEATDVILIIYSESTLDDIKTFEEKLLKDIELDENEENLLYFKKHIDQYLNEFHKGEELTRESLLNMVENNLVLKYLEQKMVEEEAHENAGDNEVEEELNNDSIIESEGEGLDA